MKKLEAKNKIFDMIGKMETNTFLFPKSWSDKIQMTDYEWSYKTYNAEKIGKDRYHNFEIYNGSTKILDINFRGYEIEVEQNIFKKQITYKDVLFYIEAIFNELHSFKNNSEGIKKIRKDIQYIKESIMQKQKELKDLEKRLLDSKIKSI